MSTLTDRLRDLADDGAQHDAGAGDLWRRGVRRHRRRRAGGAALAVLVVASVVGVGTQLVPSPRQEVAPAVGSGPLPLPDRIQLPSAWAAGTDDDGPTGPLVAVLGAPRKELLNADSTGLVGLSATGDYRFLDMPGYGADASSGVALAPDGRHVAYGFDGPTTAEPGGLQGEALAGIAVFDTVTGEVRRHDARAPHGIAVHDLVWVDDDTLLAGYSTYDGVAVEDGEGGSSASGTVAPTLVWDLDQAGPVPSATVLDHVGAPTGDGRLLGASGRRTTFTAADGSVTDGPVLPVDAQDGRVLLSPDGDSIAWIEDPDPDEDDGTAHAVLVADLADPTGTLRRLDHVDNELIGWRDDTHLVTAGFDGRWRSVEVGDGSAQEVTRVPLERYSPGVVLAGDAVRGPVLHTPEPDRVVDPRLLVGLATIGVVLLLGLALALRRARRARLG